MGPPREGGRGSDERVICWTLDWIFPAGSFQWLLPRSLIMFHMRRHLAWKSESRTARENAAEGDGAFSE